MTKLYLVSWGDDYYPRVDYDWKMITSDKEKALDRAKKAIQEHREKGSTMMWFHVHELSEEDWTEIFYEFL